MALQHESKSNDPILSFRNEVHGSLSLVVAGQEMLRFEPNGDVMVRGEKVESNLQVYEAFRRFMSGTAPGIFPMEEEFVRDLVDAMDRVYHASDRERADAIQGLFEARCLLVGLLEPADWGFSMSATTADKARK